MKNSCTNSAGCNFAITRSSVAMMLATERWQIYILRKQRAILLAPFNPDKPADVLLRPCASFNAGYG
jgi:hypothetical protein